MSIMQTKQQLETEATLLTALQRRNQPSTPAGGGEMNRQIVGRKKDTQAFLLAMERLRVDLDQVRRQGKSADDEETKQLADSIRTYGLLHPVDVRWIEADDIYEIVSGERRYIAVKEILRWTEVPVRILDVPEENIVWLQLHENLQRKNLHPLDLAQAIRTGMDQGLTLDQVAEKLAKSTTWVQKALTVAKDLTPEASQLLRSTPKGQSLDTAYEIATLPVEEQQVLAQTVIEQNLNQQELRSVAGKLKKRKTQERKARGGRPTKAKPYTRTLRSANGVTITISARKASIPVDDVIAALREAITTLQEQLRDAA